jgi:hypothetical protein
MAKTSKAATVAVKKAASLKEQITSNDIERDPELRQLYKVTEKTSQEDIIRYDQMPGVELQFDTVFLPALDDGFVGMLSASSQKAYWLAKAEYENKLKLSNQALFETPKAVDPQSKLLDGPHGRSNPLVRDQEEIQKLLPEYYVTWRIEGGQGDLDGAMRAGFKVIRKPIDDTERKNKSPLEWSGERWKIRDGTIDPTSGDEIQNVMVYIRLKAWNENLEAMSMISHNAYSANKKQFVEGVDNISRDMLSARERIQVADLDELHIEEHTEVVNGKRVQVDSRS